MQMAAHASRPDPIALTVGRRLRRPRRRRAATRMPTFVQPGSRRCVRLTPDKASYVVAWRSTIELAGGGRRCGAVGRDQRDEASATALVAGDLRHGRDSPMHPAELPSVPAHVHGRSARLTGRERRVRTPFHPQCIAHPRACGKTLVVPQNRRPRPEPAKWGSEMRVLLSADGSSPRPERCDALLATGKMPDGVCDD